MTTTSVIQAFETHYERRQAIGYALRIINFDAATVAPKAAVEDRSKVIGYWAVEDFKLGTSEEFNQILSNLESVYDQLSPEWQRITKEERKAYEKVRKLPEEDVRAYSMLLAEAEVVWEKAKETNDFALYEPYLVKIVDFQRRFATLFGVIGGSLYNTLLDEYEEGMTIQRLDDFFATLRARIVPLVQKIAHVEQPRRDFMHRRFDRLGQLALAKEILPLIGYDMSRGVLAESAHPFTSGISKNDTRVTTHVFETNFISSVYSTIHEGGHGIYDQFINPEYKGTPLGDGASMAVHESQSRFYENIIGRSRSFTNLLFERVKHQFPGVLDDVSSDEFYRAINIAEPSFIRTESDELTYSLHIMVRYQLEKQLIEGTLPVKDLPHAWNALMKEYLGVVPPTDSLGVLQDVHWSGGAFGYFPSYALGNAYSAQLLYAMKKDLDVDGLIAKADFIPIRDWFQSHVYKYGKLLPPGNVLEQATGEPLNPDYYCTYLEQKFSSIYGL